MKTNERYDLCLSVEVAEHIPESNSDIFIKSLCALSNNIIFTAAKPGQGGKNHVNEQLPEYWINKFRKYGYSFQENEQTLIKQKIKGFRSFKDDNFFYQNLLIFKNKN